MDCMTFQKLIPAYINGELNDETLNEFLLHLKNCSQCTDELEIHYIVMKGVDILDKTDSDYNLSASFRSTVEESRTYIQKRKLILRLSYVFDTVLFWSIILCVILFIRMYLGRWFNG